MMGMTQKSGARGKRIGAEKEKHGLPMVPTIPTVLTETVRLDPDKDDVACESLP